MSDIKKLRNKLDEITKKNGAIEYLSEEYFYLFLSDKLKEKYLSNPEDCYKVLMEISNNGSETSKFHSVYQKFQGDKLHELFISACLIKSELWGKTTNCSLDKALENSIISKFNTSLNDNSDFLKGLNIISEKLSKMENDYLKEVLYSSKLDNQNYKQSVDKGRQVKITNYGPF